MKCDILFIVCILVGLVFAQDTLVPTSQAATEDVSTPTSPIESSAVATPTATPTATSSATASTSLSGCFSDSPFSTTDYFADSKLTDPLQSSSLFKVTYANTYKTVQNIILGEYYILYCTQTKPNLTDVQSKSYIQIPVTNFAAVDTRVIGFLDLLGHSNNIVYIGDTGNLTSPCVTPTPAYFDQAGIIDRTRYDLAIYPTTSVNDPKGVGLGMNYESSPLATAEWIKYIALFTNQEKASEVIFNKIKANYEVYRNSINQADIPWRRNITFMSYDPSSTQFNVPNNIYFQNLTADAGAKITVPLVARPGSPLTMKGQMQNSSVVIDLSPSSSFKNNFDDWQSWMGYSESSVNAAADAAFRRYETIKPYVNDPEGPPFERNSQLWRLDLVASSDSSDWWTRGFARPDLLIQDLIEAQFPNFFSNRDRVFLRHFSDNESIQTKSADQYGCTVDNLATTSFVTYSNDVSDVPVLSISSTFPKAGVIGLGVAGGLVALACVAGGFLALKRKIKDRRLKQFNPLEEDHPDNNPHLDRQPMMLGASHNEPSSPILDTKDEHDQEDYSKRHIV
ncbi:hypothetical protein J3Q64DRAFT_1178940 [Phycomyces blakesleeanus]|uniref:Uncharacterized protein n=2 Tax=Phycomyces blakesleeanus TaxID=4837 RepID=A0A167JHF4_PHYB8|nr:hypothetical protein PHYBLDRAFT_189460 [Phycomyces blakesleeanus NRRL 1555(-)]OAD65989.1 hypothetical protein PHYBLDRAFT_189460 [Phycomyces blakesleeanus NRRL 1555(-)]|eukprot:XP_018284029.1 hypothetical protein PHYBLDRAFT_189460 [Phycomyces blakesleeanus NRRL 1555(-)]